MSDGEQVYERLALQFFPEVAQHLRKAGVVPEAYTQKWFCGLCIQVLPYKALFDYFDAFFELGHIFLFQFAVQSHVPMHQNPSFGLRSVEDTR